MVETRILRNSLLLLVCLTCLVIEIESYLTQRYVYNPFRAWKHSVGDCRLQSTQSSSRLYMSDLPTGLSIAEDGSLDFGEDRGVSLQQNITLAVYNNINIMINKLIKFDQEEGIESLDHTYLTDNAHILCKGRHYEEVMSQIVAMSNSSEAVHIKRVHAFLSGFITSERKARAKLKTNYVLAGAASNRVDEAIETLVQSGEIDDDLVSYLESTIRRQQEKLRLMEEAAEYNSVFDETLKAKGDASRLGQEKALQILQMVLRRVKAEQMLKGRDELKLLAKVINIADYKERITFIKQKITKIEDMHGFAKFLRNGIQHINRNGPYGKITDTSDEFLELKPEYLEKMKDILLDVEDILATVTKRNDDVYSSEEN